MSSTSKTGALAAEWKAGLGLSIGERRVQQLTNDSDRFVFYKVKRGPILTQKNKTARLERTHLHHNKFSHQWGFLSSLMK